jgi:hypothetical protein
MSYVIIKLFKEGQTIKISSRKSRSCLLKILTGPLLKIFILQNPYPMCWSNIYLRKKNSQYNPLNLSIFEKIPSLMLPPGQRVPSGQSLSSPNNVRFGADLMEFKPPIVASHFSLFLSQPAATSPKTSPPAAGPP